MTAAVQRREALAIGTSCTQHIISVLSIRSSVALRMKAEPRTMLFADVVEPIVGHVATIVPWGTSRRVRITLGEVLGADVTRIKHDRVREIAREQRARFASRSV